MTSNLPLISYSLAFVYDITINSQHLDISRCCRFVVHSICCGFVRLVVQQIKQTEFEHISEHTYTEYMLKSTHTLPIRTEQNSTTKSELF